MFLGPIFGTLGLIFDVFVERSTKMDFGETGLWVPRPPRGRLKEATWLKLSG